METWGYVILIVGALVLGYLAQYVSRQEFTYEGLALAIGAAVGGFVASEYLGSLSNWGTELYGMRIFPALIGGIIVAAAVELAMRYLMPAKS